MNTLRHKTKNVPFGIRICYASDRSGEAAEMCQSVGSFVAFETESTRRRFTPEQKGNILREHI
jgi:hypothetical protein